MNRNGWSYKKLGEVAKIINGKNQKAVEDSNGQYPICGSGGIMGYATDFLCPENCVIIGRKGNINRPLFMTQKFWNVDTAFGIKANDVDLVPKFLFYFCQSFDFQKLNKAVTIPSLVKSDLLKIDLPVPSIECQDNIVSELDSLNDSIVMLQQQVKDLDSLAQSLFYDIFGDPIDNPKGWVIDKLQSVCKTITDGDHLPPPKSNSGIPFITISNINKDTREIDFTNTFFVPQDYYDNIKTERKPKINDILYTVTGSYGIPVIIKNNRKFCFQRHIALISPYQEMVNSTFLCHWMLCPSVKAEADRVATGIAQKTVSLNSIRQFKIILPPIALQQNFSKKIEIIDSSKTSLYKQIAEIQNLLAARMQYWFD